MKRFSDLMGELWRAECQHPDIREAVVHIRSLLNRRCSVASIEVQRLERARPELVLAAIDPDGRGVSARKMLAVTELAGLEKWLNTGKLVVVGTGDAPPKGLAALLGPDRQGPLAAVPLQGAQTVGVLLVHGNSATSEDDLRLLGELLRDPIRTALDNDQRFRELEQRRAAAEADKQELMAHLGRDEVGPALIGADTGLRQVMERVVMTAQTDVPVLILGETGAGKELVARTIHQQSRRKNGPFIRVNCGAIPPELIDSELFGHERGAFTGASSTRRGWFERADGGTLFLDEIGELPAPAQVRLLRVLQDGTFKRVGGQKTLHTDLRLVAATHRDLPAMARKGQVREDLWYRIAVFPLLLPPLRDRRGDIPALAAELALRASRRYGLRLQLPTAADLLLLCEYDWPGNIRELGSVIDRAAILGKGESLEIAAALGLEDNGTVKEELAPITIRRAEADGGRVSVPPNGSKLETLDTAIRAHIERALMQTAGRIEGPYGCARLLNINPHTLRAKMRKLEIEWADFRR